MDGKGKRQAFAPKRSLAAFGIVAAVFETFVRLERVFSDGLMSFTADNSRRYYRDAI